DVDPALARQADDDLLSRPAIPGTLAETQSQSEKGSMVRRQLLRLSLCLIMVGATHAAGSAELAERRPIALGTGLNLRVGGQDRAAALEAGEGAAGEVARVEELLSTWKTGGPLDRLNHSRPKEPVEVGTEVAGLLHEILMWSSRTEGAFDPTVAPLVRLWDLRGSGRVPSRSEIKHALLSVGPDKISVDAARGRAFRPTPDTAA